VHLTLEGGGATARTVTPESSELRHSWSKGPELDLQTNQLTGSIPTQLGNLTNLQVLNLHRNRLTGPIPSQLGNLASLVYAALNANQLTGSIPTELGSLTSIQSLFLDENRLTGAIPTQLGSLTSVHDLDLDFNQLSGAVPTELASLSELQNLELQGNQLSGSIPSELGGLTNLQALKLGFNQLSGTVPSELGNLSGLAGLELLYNRLSGPVPAQLGSLAALESLQLCCNQLSGAVPTELTSLSALTAGSSDFRWNALHTSDAPLRSFLNGVQDGGDWESTQTIAPTGLAAGTATPVALLVTWTPIAYTTGTGGYRVYVGTTPGGPYTLYGTTIGKAVSAMNVTGLSPHTPYYFVVEAVTQAHPFNPGAVVSERTGETTGTTLLPALSIDNVSVTEGHSGTTNALFTVSLNASSGQTVTVDYTTADGSAAVADGDYAATSGSLTFAPGTTTQPVTVVVNGDAGLEGDETFAVDLSGATNATVADARGVATIVNDDATSLVQFSAATYGAGEATPTATITVRRTGLLTGSLTVDYTTGDGSATAGVDYQAQAGTLSFGPGVTTRTFTVPLVNDTLDEPDETVVLRLARAEGPGAALGPLDSALLTIRDSDAGGVVQFSAAAYSIAENTDPATITVTRTGGLASQVSVDYTATSGTASSGADFTAVSGTLTFAANQTAATFPVAIVNDSDAEGVETVNLQLSNPGGGATLGSRASAALSIVDDESTVEVGALTYSVTEGLPAQVLVKRGGSLAGTATVHYATANGTASSGTDYTAASGVLTFAPTVASRTISIPTAGGTLNEADETFTVALDTPTGVALGQRASTTVTIKDNDPAGVLQFGAASYSVAESGGSATITVTRTGGTASGVTVGYMTVTGTAMPGADYTDVAGTLTFGASQTSLTFRVPVLNDTVPEGSETVWLALFGEGGGAALGPRSTATLTISDNDAPAFQFSAGSYSVSEGVAQATVTVRRVGSLAQAATVEYATSDGTGSAAQDYTASGGALAFPAGAATRTFVVPILNDALDETVETVNLTLGAPSAGHTLGSPAAAVLTIRDDDAAGTIQFGSPVFSEVEGPDGTLSLATVKVTRTGGTASGATVDYATSDGTASAGGDYSATSGTLTFAAGQTSATFSVEVMGDAEVEGNETVNLALSNPGGRATLGSRTRPSCGSRSPPGRRS
jgi:hypothetical protein